MTPKIEVSVWKIGCMELRMWDLPGQPAFHVSHQFHSMGGRGIFIVMVCLEKEGCIEYQFRHWLPVKTMK